MSTLKGGEQLSRRLKALKLAFKPIGRDWADETAQEMRVRVPVKTGRLRGSFRRRNATQKKATVVGHYTAYFVDAGPKPHDIVPKRAKGLVFQGRSGTIFARKVHHRGYRARPFRAAAARAGLRKAPLGDALTKAWNDAA